MLSDSKMIFNSVIHAQFFKRIKLKLKKRH